MKDFFWLATKNCCVCGKRIRKNHNWVSSGHYRAKWDKSIIVSARWHKKCDSPPPAVGGKYMGCYGDWDAKHSVEIIFEE